MAHLAIRPVAVVYDIIKGYFGGYCYRTLLEVVSQLRGFHEHRVHYLLVMWIPGLAWS